MGIWSAGAGVWSSRDRGPGARRRALTPTWPALAAKRFAAPLRLVVGYVTGLAGYLTGLVASSVFDLPTGAVIVVALLTMLVAAALVAAISPRGMRAVAAPASA